MMSCYQVSQYSANTLVPLNSMNGPERAMIHFAGNRFVFKMRVGAITADITDVILEFGFVLAEVMPKPGQSGPLRGPETFSEFPCQPGYGAKMRFKIMLLPRS